MIAPYETDHPRLCGVDASLNRRIIHYRCAAPWSYIGLAEYLLAQRSSGYSATGIILLDCKGVLLVVDCCQEVTNFLRLFKTG